MTLNELKELSSRKLYAMWNRGEFPYDFAKNCGMCLVQHRTMPSGCWQSGHVDLKHDVPKPPLWLGQARWLKNHLEELYALRVFYAKLYPKPLQVAEPVDERQECVAQ